MLTARQRIESPINRSTDFELFGASKRPGPALHVKIDSHRVVERRATELRRLQKQFNGVVKRTSRFQDDTLEAWRSESYVPARQRWCPRLERDVRAVCSEAGLSNATTIAIVDATQRGVILQNPGVLLSRLLRFQECLSDPLGRRGMLSVLRAAPSLLRYSPETLRWNVDMLGALLPEGSAVAAAVRRAPMLLGASAITLWGNFEGLRRLLRLDNDAALRLIVRAPRLLLNSQGALEGRLEALMLLAGGVPRRAVAAAIARQPSLLGYFPGTLERNLRTLAAVLAVPFSRVQPLLLKQPALAMLARDSIRERVASLRDAACLYDDADLASVVIRQPSLLTLSPDTVRRKVAVVARVLDLEDRPDELHAVLRGAPQLLTLASDSIQSKAAALRDAVAPCSVLRAQLQRAPPQTMAMWLCFSARRYEHVRAVAESQAPESISVEEKRTVGHQEMKSAGGDTYLGERQHQRQQRQQKQHRDGEDGSVAASFASTDGSCRVACPGAAMVCVGGREGEGEGGDVVGRCGTVGAKRRRGRPRRVVRVDPVTAAQLQLNVLQQGGSQGEGEGAEGVVTFAATEAVGMAANVGLAAGGYEREGARPRLSLYALLRDGGTMYTPEAAVPAAASTVRSKTTDSNLAPGMAIESTLAVAMVPEKAQDGSVRRRNATGSGSTTNYHATTTIRTLRYKGNP